MKMNDAQVYDNSGGEISAIRLENAQVLPLPEATKNGLQSTK